MSETTDNKLLPSTISPTEVVPTNAGAAGGQAPGASAPESDAARREESMSNTVTPVHPSEEEEDAMIEREFQALLVEYLKSNHRKKVDIIERAFRFAKEAHHGIRLGDRESLISCTPLP